MASCKHWSAVICNGGIHWALQIPRLYLGRHFKVQKITWLSYDLAFLQQISPLCFLKFYYLASLFPSELMTEVPADLLWKLECSQHCFLKPVVLCMLRACFMCLVHNSLLVCTCWGSRVSRAYAQQVVPRECLGKQMLESAGVNRCCSDLSACPASQVSGGYSVTENDWLK